MVEEEMMNKELVEGTVEYDEEMEDRMMEDMSDEDKTQTDAQLFFDQQANEREFEAEEINRNLYAATLEARARGWGPAWFSTNVAGGRCETCEGVGERIIRLPDLPAMRVPCDVCEGRRFRIEIDAVRWRGLAIHQVLAQPLDEAASLFRDVPRAQGALAAARDVGLGYIPLGESSRALSTGELLRLRLAAALGKGSGSRTLYVLDEPATGLHPDDVANLLGVLLRLADAGHTVVVVEHDPQFVAEADHLIELGPGPGAAGGRLIYEGPPAGLLHAEGSPTGQWLRDASSSSQRR